MAGAAGVDNTQRRKWDRDAYAKRAAERELAEKESEKNGGRPAPPARGGVHLAFVGPDVDVSTTASRATSFCRLAPNLTASAHSETAGAYLSRLSPSAPCMVMGFNTGLGGGGARSRARGRPTWWRRSSARTRRRCSRAPTRSPTSRAN